MTITRRGFMQSILALGAAPAIVKAESLMKLWTPPTDLIAPFFGIDTGAEGFTIAMFDAMTKEFLGEQPLVLVPNNDGMHMKAETAVMWPITQACRVRQSRIYLNGRLYRDLVHPHEVCMTPGDSFSLHINSLIKP